MNVTIRVRANTAPRHVIILCYTLKKMDVNLYIGLQIEEG